MFSLKDLPAIKEWFERATQEFGGQAKEWTKQQIPKLLNLYPPYLGAGIRVTGYDNSHTWFDVEMELTPWNRNYVGVHFGGSLYSMCDPFFMMILMHNLGNDFVVWDRAAEIQFKRPGQTKVFRFFWFLYRQFAPVCARIWYDFIPANGDFYESFSRIFVPCPEGAFHDNSCSHHCVFFVFAQS